MVSRGLFSSTELGTKHLMPYTMREHPHWAQVAVRTCRVLAYASAVVCGVAAFLFSTSTLTTPAAYIMVCSMALFGLICLVGTLMLNYILEWISLFFLCAGLSCYVISAWFLAASSPNRVAGTAALTMLLLFLCIRVIDLTVYWLKNVKVARMAKGIRDDA
jgi:hypothetical protein